MPVLAYLLPSSIIMTVFDPLMLNVETVKTEHGFASSHFKVHLAYRTLVHFNQDSLIFVAALSHIKKRLLRFTVISSSCVFVWWLSLLRIQRIGQYSQADLTQALSTQQPLQVSPISDSSTPSCNRDRLLSLTRAFSLSSQSETKLSYLQWLAWSQVNF